MSMLSPSTINLVSMYTDHLTLIETCIRLNREQMEKKQFNPEYIQKSVDAIASEGEKREAQGERLMDDCVKHLINFWLSQPAEVHEKKRLADSIMIVRTSFMKLGRLDDTGFMLGCFVGDEELQRVRMIAYETNDGPMVNVYWAPPCTDTLHKLSVGGPTLGHVLLAKQDARQPMRSISCFELLRETSRMSVVETFHEQYQIALTKEKWIGVVSSFVARDNISRQSARDLLCRSLRGVSQSEPLGLSRILRGISRLLDTHGIPQGPLSGRLNFERTRAAHLLSEYAEFTLAQGTGRRDVIIDQFDERPEFLPHLFAHSLQEAVDQCGSAAEARKIFELNRFSTNIPQSHNASHSSRRRGSVISHAQAAQHPAYRVLGYADSPQSRIHDRRHSIHHIPPPTYYTPSAPPQVPTTGSYNTSSHGNMGIHTGSGALSQSNTNTYAPPPSNNGYYAPHPYGGMPPPYAPPPAGNVSPPMNQPPAAWLPPTPPPAVPDHHHGMLAPQAPGAQPGEWKWC